MKAARPDTALPPAIKPPFGGRSIVFSSLDILPIVISVVTTGSRRMSTIFLNIGKLSVQTGVKVETIRYYEKIGLMPQPPRKQSGHRIYGKELVLRLRFIKRGRELGFSLENIRGLLGLEDKKPSCAQVYNISTEHLAEIRKKIADLKKLERTLSAISRKCARDESPDCAIIKELYS